MSAGKSRLRYSSIEAMPESLRRMVAGQAAAGMENQPQKTGVISHSPSPGKNKYGAVATVVDGIRFDSKREARYYEQLKLRQTAGEVIYWLRQAPIHLPGGTRLVIDFLEFHSDGSVHYVDVKGRETPAFKIKRREIEAVYPIRIELA